MNDLLYSLEDLKLPFSDYIPSEPSQSDWWSKIIDVIKSFLYGFIVSFSIIIIFFYEKVQH